MPNHCNKPMVKDGKEHGKQRYKCRVCGARPRLDTKPYEAALNKCAGNISQAAKLLKVPITEMREIASDLDLYHRRVKKSKRYIITSAQVCTPVFDKFLDSLETYAEMNKAEIIIIPFRYKNPTSIFNTKNTVWWDERVIPYLCDTRFKINDNLVVMSDIKIIPTALDPLSGLEEISGKRSCIFGHASLALKTVPVRSGEMPKIICTTGTVTKRNYTDSKQGKRGEFHHVHSAQLVEVQGDMFHVRQLNACSDGSFIDLDWEYLSSGEAYPAAPPWIVLGDLHHHAVCSKVITGTRKLVQKLNPEGLVLHDALDFYSRNHHHRGEPFINLAKYRGGLESIKKEIEALFTDLVKWFGTDRKMVFPYSNHPAALAKWIKESDWKTDPVNAEFYLETALAMVRSTVMRGHKSHTVDPFAYWGRKLLGEQGVFLGPNDNYTVNKIAVDMHGHIGANGARGGTVKAFSKLATKNITGHGHGPGIHHGGYRVGTSSVMDQEYVNGPSSWLNTHCLIYPNGKRTLINFINGKCGV